MAAMIFFPAIDLKDGRCVRLIRGDMATAEVFNDSPRDQARAFAAAGCQWLHVVDLNGAFAGRPVNGDAVSAILDGTSVPVQLGGGIRNLATIENWLSLGIARVILGTAAACDPDMVRQACSAFPGRIAASIDARDGHVAISGWSKTLAITALDLARRLADAGVCAIIHTDIARDGAMGGPNIEATLVLADIVSIPVILSGGISSMADLAAVRAAGSGIIAGVICGRAIYEGRVDPRAAVAFLAGTPEPEVSAR
jgi:phosphoribosylformimino-5-aminoimidazole carboxamide ribotide isomerase